MPDLPDEPMSKSRMKREAIQREGQEITLEELIKLRLKIERHEVADAQVMRDWDESVLREYYHAAHYLNRELRRLADKLYRAGLRDVEARGREEERMHAFTRDAPRRGRRLPR